MGEQIAYLREQLGRLESVLGQLGGNVRERDAARHAEIGAVSAASERADAALADRVTRFATGRIHQELFAVLMIGIGQAVSAAPIMLGWGP